MKQNSKSWNLENHNKWKYHEEALKMSECQLTMDHTNFIPRLLFGIAHLQAFCFELIVQISDAK